MFSFGCADRKMPVPKGAPLKPALGYASEALSGTEGKRKTRMATFRLEERALTALNESATADGISPRSWLEKTVLRLANPHVVSRKIEHPDLRSLVFQAARAGNNLNQLAHKFNRLDLAGQLRGSELHDALAVLHRIRAQFEQAVARAR